jgi:hypothetical protein
MEMTFRTRASVGRLALIIGLALLAGKAVSAQDVKYNFMPGTDFSKYHTFKWVDLPSNVHPNQIVSQEIKEAVNTVLNSKGLTQATSDTADVYVGYQCSVDQERQLNAWGMRGLGGGIGGATTSTITNGTLAVDFYDPTSKDLIWRGTATKTLNPSGNQQKDMEKLNKAVAKLLKNFPPSPKS